MTNLELIKMLEEECAALRQQLAEKERTIYLRLRDEKNFELDMAYEKAQ
jgi:hypothetical protein